MKVTQTNYSEIMSQSEETKFQLIIQLGKALHKYGIPSYKIESYLKNISNNMGIKGSFMDSPTWINYVFKNEKNQDYNYIESTPPGTLNLGAYSRVVDLTKKIIHNEIDISLVENKLAVIERKTKFVNQYTLLLAYMLSGSAFNLMIGSNWISVLISGILGAMVYLLVFFSAKSEYLTSVLESIAAFTATIAAGLASIIFPTLNVGLTIVSAIIIFIPGLSITTALEEITSKNLVSGTAKLFDAIISLFKQFFGVLLGLTILNFFLPVNIYKHNSEIPYWFIFLAIPLFSISLIPIFQVRRKDIFLGVVTGILAFTITWMFSIAGILFSTFVGTVGVVIASKYFGKLTRTPRTVYVTQGIIMLVPGSKSMFGLSNLFLSTQMAYMGNIWEQIAYIFMGILGGLLFGGVFRYKENN